MIKFLFVIVALFLLNFPAYAEKPLNEQPFYGGDHIPQVPKNTELSRNAAERAWKAYYEGDLDIATKRFNQSWIFDQENPEVYWGLGLIAGQRASQENPEENLKKSIEYLHVAKEKAPQDGRIIGDLAYSYTLSGQYLLSEQNNLKAAEENFEKAALFFSEADKKEPNWPPILANWSVFYFYTKNFSEARRKAEEAINLGYEFDPSYLEQLKSHVKQ